MADTGVPLARSGAVHTRLGEKLHEANAAVLDDTGAGVAGRHPGPEVAHVLTDGTPTDVLVAE